MNTECVFNIHGNYQALTSSTQGQQIQVINLFPGPGRSAQKLQTGLDARVIGEALDRDAPAQFLPTVLLHQMSKDHFERKAVQGVIRLCAGHGRHGLLAPISRSG